jgi:hypothetical protein
MKQSQEVFERIELTNPDTKTPKRLHTIKIMALSVCYQQRGREVVHTEVDEGISHPLESWGIHPDAPAGSIENYHQKKSEFRCFN